MCGRLVSIIFVTSTSLIIHGELNHIIMAPCHMFTPVERLAWENVGGGCYIICVRCS